MGFWDEYRIEIDGETETAFVNANNVYPDGCTPMYRDVDGALWAMTGHSHMGEIAMFRGVSLDDMKKAYPIHTEFSVGHADYAFSGIRYPEGIRARGSIWPFGLYICPKTHRFFCFFHNESGWNGHGTAYDARGLCETPAFDSDFRHVGLMHSDDEGRNWVFDRWVLSGETVGCTRAFVPDSAGVVGQDMGSVALGSGDFSFFADPEGEYLYILYNIIRVNTDRGEWESCHAYIARSPRREDGVMADFVKYYGGAFSEPGNFGRETAIAHNVWHPFMAYFEKHGRYLLCGSRVKPGPLPGAVEDVMEMRESRDMIHWSQPVHAKYKGEVFGNHYVFMAPDGAAGPVCRVAGDSFSLLTNHNGTDVKRYAARLERI